MFTLPCVWSTLALQVSQYSVHYNMWNYSNYTSPYLHHTNLTGLQAYTQYHYAIEADDDSTVWNFTTGLRPGTMPDDEPLVFAVVGDIGQVRTRCTSCLQGPCFILSVCMSMSMPVSTYTCICLPRWLASLCPAHTLTHD